MKGNSKAAKRPRQEAALNRLEQDMLKINKKYSNPEDQERREKRIKQEIANLRQKL